MIAAGVVPDTSADTLLMYAYAQKGVDDVRLEIDNQGEGDRKVKVKYFIKYEPAVYLKYKAMKKAELIKNDLARKAALLALAKAGAPIAIPATIKRHAQEYLPPESVVEVQVVE